LQGCRCVELDVWDGDNGEPVLFHGVGVGGFTMTSKVPLSDVLRAINDCAFANNDQPVILSLENHASAEQQVRMADLIRDIFGDRLYREPLWQGDARFPSPAELRGRIIIQGKKPTGSHADESESDEEAPDGEEVSDASRQVSWITLQCSRKSVQQYVEKNQNHHDLKKLNKAKALIIF